MLLSPAHQVWHHCEQSTTTYDSAVNLLDVVQLYQNKEKVAEHVAAEGSKDAVAKVIYLYTTWPCKLQAQFMQHAEHCTKKQGDV